jgi:hypothetical protein
MTSSAEMGNALKCAGESKSLLTGSGSVNRRRRTEKNI